MSKRILIPLVIASLILALIPSPATGAPSLEQGFLRSWDGTLIKYNLFIPEAASEENRVPVVLRTHGWGGTGEASYSGMVKSLVDAGYAVLTWDQRGFGQSGGQVEIDHPDWEGRDVMALIDFAGSKPQIMKRGTVKNGGRPKPDPVVGMSGGSYAGGIQLMAAAIDHRIDAIAPEIAWNDLPRSIFPNGVPKFGWDTLLYAAGQTALTGGLSRGETGNYNPEIHRSYAQVAATNDPSAFYPWFDERSPKHYIDSIAAPTLVIQGTIDTLFSVTEGVNNFQQIRDNLLRNGKQVPSKLMLYNSGHTIRSSFPPADAGARARSAIINWFDRYLKREEADTGALVEYQDNFGNWHSSASWPVGLGVTAAGQVTALASPAPSGGGDIAKGNPNVSQTSARIDVLTADDNGTMVVGVPTLKGSAEGIGTGAFLFFKLVNATTNQVLSDQVTALSIDLLSGTDNFDIQLEGVSYLLEPGEQLVLEVSTGSAMYSSYRGAAIVDLELEVTVPVA